MAYFDKEKNTRVRFSNLSSTYNISVSTGVSGITPDIAEMLNLYRIIQSERPEYDPELQRIFEDFSADPIFDDELKTVSWPWEVKDIWEDEVDEDGNVIKTAAELKAEHDEAEAQAQLDAPTEEEIAERDRLTLFQQEVNSQRMVRNDELLRTDIYVSVSDFPLPNESTLEDWTTYRAQLRDMFEALDETTDTFEDVRNAMWTMLESAPDYIAPEAPAEEEPTE